MKKLNITVDPDLVHKRLLEQDIRKLRRQRRLQIRLEREVHLYTSEALEGEEVRLIERIHERWRTLRAKDPDGPQPRFEVFARTYEDAYAFKALFEANQSELTCDVWLGMGALDSKGRPYCKRKLYTQPLASAGGDTDPVCVSCSHRHNCILLKQRDKQVDVWVSTHAKAQSPRMGFAGADERPVDSTGFLGDIGELLLPDTRMGYREIDDILATYISAEEAHREMLKTAKSRNASKLRAQTAERLRAAVRRAAHTGQLDLAQLPGPKALHALSNHIVKRIPAPVFSEHLTEVRYKAEANDFISQCQRVALKYRMVHLLRGMVQCFFQNSETLPGLRFAKGATGYYLTCQVVQMPAFCYQASRIEIVATTAVADLYRPFVGLLREYHSDPLPTPLARFFRLRGSYRNWAFESLPGMELTPAAQEAVDLIRSLSNRYHCKGGIVPDAPKRIDVLFMVPKTLKERLLAANKMGLVKLPDNVAIRAFGEIASVQKYRKVAALYILGRYFPPPPVLAASAERVAAEKIVLPVLDGENAPSKPGAFDLMRDGSHYELARGNPVHDHWAMQAMYDAKVYGENRRAIELVQPSRRTADNLVDIYIQNMLELPGVTFEARVSAEEVINWMQLCLHRGFAPYITEDGRVLCSREELLTRCFPSRFADESSVKKHLRNIQLPIPADAIPFVHPKGFVIQDRPGSTRHYLLVDRKRANSVANFLRRAFPDAHFFSTNGKVTMWEGMRK